MQGYSFLFILLCTCRDSSQRSNQAVSGIIWRFNYFFPGQYILQNSSAYMYTSNAGAVPRGGGGGGEQGGTIAPPPPMDFLVLLFCLSAQRSVMLMMIYYSSPIMIILAKTIQIGKKCVRVSPPPPPPPHTHTHFLRAGAAVARHFATPKQTPWPHA